MLTNTAYLLAGLLGVGIVVLGVRGICTPRAAAADFGLPAQAPADPALRTWLAVKGVRDIASGLFIAVLLIAGTPQLLGAVMLVATGIPIGDGLIVLRDKGSKVAAYGIHGGTAAVMLATGVLLLLAGSG